MFNLFKDKKADVKTIRAALLQFIKEKLQRAEGGEGAGINGIYLYINCGDAERYLYEAAIYANVPGKFREEIQRIADDFAIHLPANWKYEVSFNGKYPEHSYFSPETNTALFLSTRKTGVINSSKSGAYLKVLSGQAEKNTYALSPTEEKVNIGRESQAQVAGGFVRKNAIAFVNGGPNDQNRSVSRQHAHLEWDADTGSFLVFADEGGIPPFNKVKVRTVDGNSIKLQAIEVGHRLQEGDQVILGDTAVLEFTYSAEK